MTDHSNKAVAARRGRRLILSVVLPTTLLLTQPAAILRPLQTAPQSRPNIIFIVLDDVGFAALGCYGSEIKTPNMDRLAAGGLRYNNFHTTALCSPTRAALLTGRNHHTVGMRVISNFVGDEENTRGRITNRAATMAEVLRDQGYNTFALGKWHLAPMFETTPAGPYDNWPLGRGFERYYGFLDGETDQFAPELTYDNHRIETPRRPGYHLTEDLIDHSIEFVRDQVSVKPDGSFFLYLAFGATHAPHQAPKEFIDRYKGVYDKGWDKIREERLARQKQIGIAPATAELSPRNPGVKAWDDLSADEKRLFIKFQETYAGFLEHTDYHLGSCCRSWSRSARCKTLWSS
jgi:arylsulfatase A-like enzyme